MIIVHLIMIDCIATAFTKYVKDHSDGIYRNCSLPWTMSALGLIDYNSTNYQPGCKLNDAIRQNQANIRFFFEAKNYNVTGCKGM